MENESSCSPLNILKRNWFTFGMIIVVLLAYFFPTVGSSYVTKKIISKIAVAIIFLMAGINLKFAELKKGLPRWTIHLTVQTFTFIIFPAVTYLSTKLSKTYITNDPIYEPIYIGIVILGCVPCSSSSAIVWTKSANGNWIIAAFNSIIANLAGIAITPMLFYMLLSQKPQTEPLTTIRDICIVLVIPMIVGKLISLLIEKKSPNTFEKLQKVKWGDIEKFLLLVIIWISFCDTFMTFKEQKLPLTSILVLIGFFSMLYLFMFGASFLLSKIKFIARDRSEALVLLFTNPSKTLALGIPLILILYKDLPTVGLFQIPLLIYQPLQLTMCGIFVNSLKKWRDNDPELKMKQSIESSKKEDVEIVIQVTSENEVKDEETISDTEKEENESIEMEELMNQTLSNETNDNEFLDFNESENVNNFELKNDIQVDEIEDENDSDMVTISIDLNYEISDPEVRDSSSDSDLIDQGNRIDDQDNDTFIGNVEPENNFEILETIDI